jgi:hypothetical protein
VQRRAAVALPARPKIKLWGAVSRAGVFYT